jgi:tRNA dimethylallyltransferase
LLIGLHIDKNELKQRISHRLDAMLATGLEEEVQQLSERYGWDCEALKGISYAQWQEYFLGSENRDQVRQKIIQATINLAKRQQTWFQRNKSIHWLSSPVNWSEVVDLITTFLSKDIS